MRNRSRRIRSPHAMMRIAGSILILTQAVLPLREAVAYPTHPGKWTGVMAWPATAVNLVLLPGTNSNYHSRVHYWDHTNASGVPGGLWGWTPPSDANVNAGTFPDASFKNLQLEPVPLIAGQPVNIFCAGQTLLADGRELITGGSEVGEGGVRTSLFFDAVADSNGAWSVADSMEFRRWYPNNTLLPDGRVVTTTGSVAIQFLTVGGLCDGLLADTATSFVQRFPVTNASAWELPTNLVLKRSTAPFDPLPASLDAGVTNLQDNSMFMFGGADAQGQVNSAARTVTRDRAIWSADYGFYWNAMTQVPAELLVGVPGARSGSAVVKLANAGEVLMFGGLREGAGPSAELWRGTISNVTITWTKVTASGLPALHGASAVYDGALDRVFIFGGTNSISDHAPTNAKVYSVQLTSSSTASVTVATQSGTNPPGPRSYASLNRDSFQRQGTPGDVSTPHWRALLFGGHTVAGALCDTLHAMWMKSATEVVWDVITPDPGSRPVGRAHHSGSVDDGAKWLVVTGGEINPATSTNDAWVFDLACGTGGCGVAGSNHWERLPDMPLAIRGHASSAVFPEPAFPRLPEIFDPQASSAGEWTTFAGAYHWQEWYAFGFAAPRMSDVPAGLDSLRVFYAGPESPSTVLHVSRNPKRWTALPSTGDYALAGSAVMYRPGKVMKAGTRDTGPDLALGATAKIDLKAESPTWASAAPADQMIGRKNHNLVILPSGEVLVVGGGKTGVKENTTNENCVKMPQLWYPDTLAAGHWYGTNPAEFKFDSSTVRRFYHGSAILLPDARVLVAGGFDDPTQMTKADIYSPYYLFNASGNPATRPVITGWPTAVAYGHAFEMTVNPGSDTQCKAVLIRPGATTHGFDQNQRYVELTFTAGGTTPSGDRIYCGTAPADPFDAPPGDYLLFVKSQSGTPSIARWVRLGTTAPNHPTRVQDLAVVPNSYNSSDQGVDLQWSPPYRDSIASGCDVAAASQYQMRYRYGTMASWNDFASGSSVSGTPSPTAPGSPMQTVHLSGLPDGVEVHVRMITKTNASGSGDWSAMSNELLFYPNPGGSGGGGEGEYQHSRAGTGAALASIEGSFVPAEFEENTLFPRIPVGQIATDRIPLPNGPHVVGDRAQVRVSRWGSGGLSVRDVRLLAVDHIEGKAFTASSAPILGTLVPAPEVRDALGSEIATSMANGTPYDGQAGNVLKVHLDETRAGTLIVTTSGEQLADGDRSGVSIQVNDGGSWKELALVAPRELPTDAVVSVPAVGDVRLVFGRSARLHAIGRVVPVAETPARTSFAPVAAKHSGLGDVPGQMPIEGIPLNGGQSLIVEFMPPPAPEGMIRDWFLEVTGVESASRERVATGLGAFSRTETLPTEWALYPARPNPFAGTLLVPFDLPRAGEVSLEVFDLLGRRIAVLAQGVWPAGRHSIVWNGLTQVGSLAAPGIYSVRLRAGEYRSRRQVVRMP